jgi:hypothetical protein
MHGTDLGQTQQRETSPVGHANAPAQAPQNPADDDYRIAADLHDILVNQIFIVSLDLHAAFSLTGDAQARTRITRAIGGLDHAINDLRRTLFDLDRHTSPPLHEPPLHEHIASVPMSRMIVPQALEAAAPVVQVRRDGQEARRGRPAGLRAPPSTLLNPLLPPAHGLIGVVPARLVA